MCSSGISGMYTESVRLLDALRVLEVGDFVSRSFSVRSLAWKGADISVAH